MFEDEGDGLTVVLGRLLAIAARLVDHPEALEPVEHFRVTDEQVTGGGFGLIEAAGVDEVDDGVRRRVEVVIVLDGVVGGLYAQPWRGPGRVLGETAALVLLAAATGTGLIASDLTHGWSWRGGDSCTRAG